MTLLPSRVLTTPPPPADQTPGRPRQNRSVRPLPPTRLRIIARTPVRPGTRTTRIQTIRLANTRSNDYVRLGSLRRLFRSLRFGETISSLRWSPVLRAAGNNVFKISALQVNVLRQCLRSL